MKFLTSFMDIKGSTADRISYTYDEIDDNGDLVSRNNKKSFYAMNNDLKAALEVVKNHISEKMG